MNRGTNGQLALPDVLRDDVDSSIALLLIGSHALYLERCNRLARDVRLLQMQHALENPAPHLHVQEILALRRDVEDRALLSHDHRLLERDPPLVDLHRDVLRQLSLVVRDYPVDHAHVLSFCCCVVLLLITGRHGSTGCLVRPCSLSQNPGEAAGACVLTRLYTCPPYCSRLTIV